MPVATERLLYVPMPFTGEAWVMQVLQSCGATRVPGLPTYCPIADIPESWRDGRTLFGSIRDPRSWYQALWHTLSNDPSHQVLLRALGQGSTRFPAFLQGVTDPSVWMSVPGRLTSLLWDWPDGNPEGGLYTATCKLILGHWGLRVEGMIDYAQQDAGLSEILQVPVQGFQPDTFGWAYSADMHRLVEQADGELAELLGYDQAQASGKLPRPVRWGGIS